MTDEVVIYTKPGCPYCKAAKEDLASRGVPFREMDVTSDPAIREEAIARAGMASVPVIVKGDEVSVGFGGS
ncbi:MAG: Uxx-star family glutaredoxin-like (seleno)protein [Thermoleophilia bacterium]|jgi:glutaredoxin|nr:glutaredoxin family protein [Actinomycetota bacterium]MCL6093210.1 glutaredoxin family protein [Actinomycetota bacterium]MDA8167029.1 glutaredoxin family protein [Actinomycetota bacterium]